MFLSNFKINGNQLFTPSVLLLISFFTYQISTQEFKDTYNTYSFLLAAAIMVFSLKVFMLTFASLESFFKSKKWVLVVFSLVIFILESGLAWLAIRELTLDSYPRYTVGAVLIANLGFYLQAFIIKIPKLVRLAIASFVIYFILFILLLTSAFNSFIGNSQLLIVFQQTTGYVSLGMEIVMLLIIGRYFVHRDLAESKL